MAYYRRYSSGWDRIGHATTPQYPGQQPCRDDMDFPINPKDPIEKLHIIAKDEEGSFVWLKRHIAVTKSGKIVHQQPITLEAQ